MPSLQILYDPSGRLQIDPDLARAGIVFAQIHLAEQDSEDIYTLAKKLAEMLLEQL